VGAQSLFCPPFSRVKTKFEWETTENSSLLIPGPKRRERKKLESKGLQRNQGV